MKSDLQLNPQTMPADFTLTCVPIKTESLLPMNIRGVTEVTPSDTEQVLATKDKLVRDDITVNPAPTEYLSTDHNGTFTPSDGKVGFSQVSVDVNPDLRPLSVSENGTYQPDGFDGYSQVDVNVDEHKFGYSDDTDDFSGGNILALISHATEYINTEYCPHMCNEVCIRLAYNDYRNTNGCFFAYEFDDTYLVRVGGQYYSNVFATLRTFKTRWTNGDNFTDILSDNPINVWLRPQIQYQNAFDIATKPLIIFRGYVRNTYDEIGGFNFYGLKCYEFGKLVKKYVPWLDENNVPCVHELIDDEYFYNVGTGAFGYIDLEGNVHDA